MTFWPLFNWNIEKPLECMIKKKIKLNVSVYVSSIPAPQMCAADKKPIDIYNVSLRDWSIGLLLFKVIILQLHRALHCIVIVCKIFSRWRINFIIKHLYIRCTIHSMLYYPTGAISCFVVICNWLFLVLQSEMLHHRSKTGLQMNPTIHISTFS